MNNSKKKIQKFKKSLSDQENKENLDPHKPNFNIIIQKNKLDNKSYNKDNLYPLNTEADNSHEYQVENFEKNKNNFNPGIIPPKSGPISNNFSLENNFSNIPELKNNEFNSELIIPNNLANEFFLQKLENNQNINGNNLINYEKHKEINPYLLLKKKLSRADISNIENEFKNFNKKISKNKIKEKKKIFDIENNSNMKITENCNNIYNYINEKIDEIINEENKTNQDGKTINFYFFRLSRNFR